MCLGLIRALNPQYWALVKRSSETFLSIPIPLATLPAGDLGKSLGLGRRTFGVRLMHVNGPKRNLLKLLHGKKSRVIDMSGHALRPYVNRIPC